MSILRQVPKFFIGALLTTAAIVGAPLAKLTISCSVSPIGTGTNPVVSADALFYTHNSIIYQHETPILEPNVTIESFSAITFNNYFLVAWATESGLFYSHNQNGSYFPGTQLTSHESDTDPFLVSDGAKVYLLFQRRLSSANTEIFLKSFSGGSWQPEQQITNNNGDSAKPKGAFDSQGTFYLVWLDDRYGQDQAWVRYKDSSGWSEEQLAIDDPNNAASAVDIATLGTVVYLSFIQDSKCYLKIGSGASFDEKILLATTTTEVDLSSNGNILAILVQKGANLYFKTKSSNGWTNFHLIDSGTKGTIEVISTENLPCAFEKSGTINYVTLKMQEITNENDYPRDLESEEEDDLFANEYYQFLSSNRTVWQETNDYVRENFLPGVWDALENAGFEKIADYPLVALIMFGVLGVMAIVVISIIFSKGGIEKVVEEAQTEGTE